MRNPNFPRRGSKSDGENFPVKFSQQVIFKDFYQEFSAAFLPVISPLRGGLSVFRPFWDVFQETERGFGGKFAFGKHFKDFLYKY